MLEFFTIGFTLFHMALAQPAAPVLVGTNPRSQPCHLTILAHGFAQEPGTFENYVLTVETSESHGRDKPGPIDLRFLNDATRLLMKGTNQQAGVELTVEFSEKSPDYGKIKAYYLRWKHGNHTDLFRCINMKLQ